MMLIIKRFNLHSMFFRDGESHPFNIELIITLNKILVNEDRLEKKKRKYTLKYI